MRLKFNFYCTSNIIIIGIIFYSIFISNLFIGEDIFSATYSNENNNNSNNSSNHTTSTATAYQEEIINLNLSTELEYLAIVPESWLSTLQPLLTWKTAKGIAVGYITLESIIGVNITAHHPNNSWAINNQIAEKIRNFIRELYFNHVPELKWLLLVGDAEIIPPFYLAISLPSENATINYYTKKGVDYPEPICPTDYYYSALSYDEYYPNETIIDYIPELYVGRLPVSTSEELQAVVDKILVYERSPPAGDWFKRVLLYGALMDVPNILDDPTTNFTDEGYNWYKDNAYEAITAILPLLPEHYEVNLLYDYNRTYGGYYEAEHDILTHDKILELMNEGLAIIDSVSHGYLSANGTLQYSGDGNNWQFEPALLYSDAELLENYYRLPFIYASACSVGNFTELDDTNFERFITTPFKGAIGIVAATVKTFRCEYEPNYSYGNWWLNYKFWELCFKHNISSPAELLYRTKHAYYEWFNSESNPRKSDWDMLRYKVNFLAYNLLGDPETSIWTEVPKKLTVKLLDKLHEGSETFRIMVMLMNGNNNDNNEDDAQPLSNATVCILPISEDATTIRYTTVQTDPNGIATLPIANLNLKAGMKLQLTVTAKNCLPFILDLEVAPGLNLKLAKAWFEPEALAEGMETMLFITVCNDGIIDVSNVKIICAVGSESNLFFATTLPQIQSNSNFTLSTVWHVTKILPDNTVDIDAVDGGVEVVPFWLKIDPEDKYAEFDESDNALFITYRINSPPEIVASIPPIILYEDNLTPVILDLSLYMIDPDNYPTLLQYELIIPEAVRVNCSIELREGTIVTIYPIREDWYGTAEFIVKVTDGVLVNHATVEIIVKPVNDPPSFVNLPARLTAVEDIPFEFKLEATDPDDNITELHYFLISAPPFVNLNESEGYIYFTPDDNTVGEYKLIIGIVDKHNGTTTASLVLTVLNRNDKPRFIETYENLVLKSKVGELLVYEFKALDDDINDSIRYVIDPPLFFIDAESGKLELLPDFNHVGIHKVKIYAIDESNATAVANITIIITEIDIVGSNAKAQFYLQILLGAIVSISTGIVIVWVVVYPKFKLIYQSYIKSRFKGSYLNLLVIGGALEIIPLAV